jgi:hypothetical protein
MRLGAIKILTWATRLSRETIGTARACVAVEKTKPGIETGAARRVCWFRDVGGQIMGKRVDRRDAGFFCMCVCVCVCVCARGRVICVRLGEVCVCAASRVCRCRDIDQDA